MLRAAQTRAFHAKSTGNPYLLDMKRRSNKAKESPFQLYLYIRYPMSPPPDEQALTLRAER
jgi:hypothetical protein